MPSANTVRVVAFKEVLCGQQQGGQPHGFKCVVFVCPLPDTGIPFANTVRKQTNIFAIGVVHMRVKRAQLLTFLLLLCRRNDVK